MTKLIELIKKTFVEWQEDKVPQLAAALTFYTILSIPPLLVLTIGIAGQFANRERAQQTLIMQIQQAMGNDAAEAITAILEVAAQPEGLSLATALVWPSCFLGLLVSLCSYKTP